MHLVTPSMRQSSSSGMWHYGGSARKIFWHVCPATTITHFYLLSTIPQPPIRSFQSLSSTCVGIVDAASVRSRQRFRPSKTISQYPIWASLNSRPQLTKTEYSEVFQRPNIRIFLWAATYIGTPAEQRLRPLPSLLRCWTDKQRRFSSPSSNFQQASKQIGRASCRERV